jgi:hypothetical protein
MIEEDKIRVQSNGLLMLRQATVVGLLVLHAAVR